MLYHPTNDLSRTYRCVSILLGRAVLRAGQHVRLLFPPVCGYDARVADSSTRHQRYHVLNAATLTTGGNRNFVHMKVMVDAGVSCIRGSRKPIAVAGSSAACSKEAPSRCVSRQ